MRLTIERKQGEGDDELLLAAVPFMLSRLLTREDVKTIRLHIVITNLAGDLGNIDLHDTPDFRLRLNHRVQGTLLLVTLAHELIHLAQVVEGRLKMREIKGLHVWYWDGEPYGSEPYADPTRLLPWEVDAESREGDLARQFVKSRVTSLNAN